MQVRVVHTVVFARGPGGGNPCPVVDAAGLSGEQMRAIAAHYGHETGFPGHDADGALRLRYFVPNHEMSMCVHATVALTTVLRQRGGLPGRAARARTASGEIAIGWDDADPPRVTVEQQPPELGPPLPDAGAVVAACGLPAGAVDATRPMRAVSVSRAKLIVPLRRAADVHAVDPDLDALEALCRAHGTTGAYLFAPHDDGDPAHVVARQFPVAAGYPEDPATGVAAGALAAYLADGQARAELAIDQGDAMGRPSRLQATAWSQAGVVVGSSVTGTADVLDTELLDLGRLT
jgi:PhzF family phenazine biosynthesis protein